MVLRATDIYRTLSQAMGSWAKAQGYRAGRRGAEWTRTTPEQVRITLVFQADKNGWDPDEGLRFTVELLAERQDGVKLRTRYTHVLDAEDAAVRSLIQARVRAKLSSKEADDEEDQDDEEWLDASDSDEWLNASDRDDIEAWWAEFLEPRYEKLLGRFLQTGGETPTPVAPTLEFSSLQVDVDRDGRSTISLRSSEAPMLSAALCSTRIFVVPCPELDVVFELDEHSRSGGANWSTLGLAQRERAWVRLGPAAHDELRSRLDADEPEDTYNLQNANRLSLSLLMS